MKTFLRYLSFVLLIVVASMITLHLAYTKVYSTAVRNKFQYVMKLEPQKIDYVFLGSSRTANHIMTSEVRKQTGGTAINLGIEGAVLGDNLLEMKLLISRKVKIRKAFLQVDYLYDKHGVSFIANQAALPFLSEPVVKDYLKPVLPDFYALYYIPFYRYMVNDYRIGFREFFFSLIGKKGRIDMRDGFIPQEGKKPLGEFKWPAEISDGNETIDEFQRICKENNIELVLFCAPVCSNSSNKEYTSKLKERMPGFRDYSAALPDQYFNNCGHLNVEGAKKFTQMLTADCITGR